ncbi:MAG: DUF2807 domain-containing protein [Alistipes sp.]|nr:DUF2807 domain-containing protein [Alistipes sp.]
MKRFLLTICALLAVVELSAQEPTATPIPESRPVKEFLSSFTAIDVDAPIKLTLIKIGEDEAPYIIYDTKGVYTSKFTIEVERKTSTLKITERNDPKRESITEVQVYFSTLTDISISKADVRVEGVISTNLLDIDISNDANFVAEIDVLDLKAFISGKSYIQLTGQTRYQTADISTAEYDATELRSISTIAESSHNAIVKVDATERLEAKTSTGGKLYYYTQPEILRSEITLFGGEITLKQ